MTKFLRKSETRMWKSETNPKPETRRRLVLGYGRSGHGRRRQRAAALQNASRVRKPLALPPGFGVRLPSAAFRIAFECRLARIPGSFIRWVARGSKFGAWCFFGAWSLVLGSFFLALPTLAATNRFVISSNG